MSEFSVPLDSFNFEEFFLNLPPPGPASLPVPNPTKSFWTHPGLSSDWPTDSDDPEGNKYANPYANEGSETPLPAKADIVIVGSGITGVSIALELSKLVRQAKRRMDVVILEARDFCSGATARNGGHLAARVAAGYSRLCELYGPEEAKLCFEIEKHTASTIVSIIKANGWEEDVDLVEGGRNYLLLSEKELMDRKSDWKKSLESGIITEDAAQWFTAEETEEKYGTFYPMLRVPGHNLWPSRLVTRLFELAKNGPPKTANHLSEKTPISNGSFTPTVNPISYIASGARAVIQKILPSSSQTRERPDNDDPFRLSLHTRTPVDAVIPCKPDAGRRWSVQTQRGCIDTDHVIYATNAYTSHLLPQLTGPDGIVPVRGQIVAIRAKVGYTDEGWPESGESRGLSRSTWVANEGFEYWFPRPHPALNHPNASSLKVESRDEPNQPRKPLVIIGGGRETLKDQGYATYDADDSIIDPQVSTALKAFLSTIFPGQIPNGLHPAESNPDNMVDSKGIEIEWSGIMGFTKSNDPLVGRVKDTDGTVVAGQYLSAGYTGHGMPRAYGCAEALAGMIWRDISTPEAPWTPPEWLPRHYLTESF